MSDDQWRRFLKAELVDVFERYGVNVAVGLTANGVAMCSSDDRVDVQQEAYRRGIEAAAIALEAFPDDVERWRSVGGEVGRISSRLAQYVRALPSPASTESDGRTG